MIKPQELIIGNYVEYRIQDELDDRKEWWELSIIDSTDLQILESGIDDDYRAMPFTEEILLKFGFYFEEGFYCLRINNTAFMTIILHGSYVNYELSNFRQKIVFSSGEFSGVHQLQNLYFHLKGEELAFKKD